MVHYSLEIIYWVKIVVEKGSTNNPKMSKTTKGDPEFQISHISGYFC